MEPTAVPEDQPTPAGELAKRAEALGNLLEVMAEAVAADGGTLELDDADYTTGVITVELAGACGTCSSSSVTLTAGVNRLLRDRLDWVTEVRGNVDTDDADAIGTGDWRAKL